MRDYEAEYNLLSRRLEDAGIDVEAVKEKLKNQEIETPSWGYADSGTRFGTFRQAGAAITIEEKIADAAQVHAFTGIAPRVAVHVAWDFPEGVPEATAETAQEHGIAIGAINPTCFADEESMMGTIANPDPRIRQKAIAHMLESVEIGESLGSEHLSLWFADGTNYPGQDNLTERKHRVTECLQTVYEAMPESMTMLIEYKPFEPAFYHTDIADWGMASLFARKCGERAKVLIDLGHHFRGTNIEHIVAVLMDEDLLGGFHFNNAKYADDDLTTGSVNPYEVFLIYHQLVSGGPENAAPDIAYMIDQSFNVKKKIPGMIQSCVNIQRAYARALIVDRMALQQLQREQNIVAAAETLKQAFNADVDPLLAVVREERGLHPEPLTAYRESGYQEKIEKERGIREPAGGLG
ncbi:MAG: L-rhamnose isomerase [Armatimonadota bacterium]